MQLVHVYVQFILLNLHSGDIDIDTVLVNISLLIQVGHPNMQMIIFD